MKKQKQGFTLIELLVVIAIIGILSAIGLVSLNGAREKARDAQRKSDLAQIKTALTLYYDDHTNTYPDSDATTAGTSIVVAGTLGTAPQLSQYLGAIPTDPKIDANHNYWYVSSAVSAGPGSTSARYGLYTHLESGAKAYYALNDVKVSGATVADAVWNATTLVKCVNGAVAAVDICV